MGRNGWLMLFFLTFGLLAAGLLVLIIAKRLQSKTMARTGVTMIIATALMSGAATLYSLLFH